jgi:hypothetical protein
MSDIIELDNERPATVIAADNIHVFIICPYCGEIHLHGSNGMLEGSEGPNKWGHRVAHCNGKYSAGYYLIGNPFTVHSEELLTERKAMNRYKKAIGVH